MEQRASKEEWEQVNYVIDLLERRISNKERWSETSNAKLAEYLSKRMDIDFSACFWTSVKKGDFRQLVYLSKKYVIDKGERFNALESISYHGRIDILQYLVEIFQMKATGKSCILLPSTKNNHIAFVRYVIENISHIITKEDKENAFWTAIFNGNLILVKLLHKKLGISQLGNKPLELNKGKRLEVLCYLSDFLDFNTAALFEQAVLEDQMDVCEFLLKRQGSFSRGTLLQIRKKCISFGQLNGLQFVDNLIGSQWDKEIVSPLQHVNPQYLSFHVIYHLLETEIHYTREDIIKLKKKIVNQGPLFKEAEMYLELLE